MDPPQAAAGRSASTSKPELPHQNARGVSKPNPIEIRHGRADKAAP
jgi:hypothetical protein